MTEEQFRSANAIQSNIESAKSQLLLWEVADKIFTISLIGKHTASHDTSYHVSPIYIDFDFLKKDAIEQITERIKDLEHDFAQL